MRALIVDDHSLFCDGLKLLLKALDVASEVAACTNAQAALALAHDDAWDLILLDWNLGMHSIGGAELLARLVALQPNARVVVISADASAHRVQEAIEAGAAGFVPKEASGELLIDAIRITSHGGIYLPSSILAIGARDTAVPVQTRSEAPQSPGPTLQSAYPRLTPRQIDVLVGAIKGSSNKWIARDLGISEGTVKQHLNAIYREIGVKGRTQAVYLLAQQGLKVF